MTLSYADRVKEMESYLEKNGWERAGKLDPMGRPMWKDPNGSTAQPALNKDNPVMLPNRDGGAPIPVYQMTGPPIPWDYQMEEAHRIQRKRDTERQERDALAAARETDADDTTEGGRKGKRSKSPTLG